MYGDWINKDDHVLPWFDSMQPKNESELGTFLSEDKKHVLKLLNWDHAPQSLTWGDISMKYLNQIDQNESCLYRRAHKMTVNVIKNNINAFWHEFLDADNIVDIWCWNWVISSQHYSSIDEYLVKNEYVWKKKTVYCNEQNAYQLWLCKKEIEKHDYEHLEFIFISWHYKNIENLSWKNVFMMSNVIQNLSHEEMSSLLAWISSTMKKDDAFLQIYFEKNNKNINQNLFDILEENKDKAQEILTNIPWSNIVKDAVKNWWIDIVFLHNVIEVYSLQSWKRIQSINKWSISSNVFWKNWIDRFERNMYWDEQSLYQRAKPTVSEFYSIDKDLVRPWVIKTDDSWVMGIWPNDFKSSNKLEYVDWPFPLYLEKNQRTKWVSRFKDKVLQVPKSDWLWNINVPFTKPFIFLRSTRRRKKIIDSLYKSINQKTLCKVNHWLVTLNYSKRWKFDDEYEVENDWNPVLDTLLLPYWKDNDSYETRSSRFACLKELIIEDIWWEILRTFWLCK